MIEPKRSDGPLGEPAGVRQKRRRVGAEVRVVPEQDLRRHGLGDLDECAVRAAYGDERVALFCLFRAR